MSWTKSLPTEPGWYWRQYPPLYTPFVSQVTKGTPGHLWATDEQFVLERLDSLTDSDNEWIRIPVPPQLGFGSTTQ